MSNQASFRTLETVAVTLAVCLMAAGFIYWKTGNGGSSSFAGDINIPKTYSDPLLIKLADFVISIAPLGAQQAEAAVNKNVVKYINAYPNTDVVQTRSYDKIKEDIILKQPGHPDIFQYQIDLTPYDFTKDADGNFIFYQKGHNGDVDYTRFTIPAPFLIDAAGNKSSTSDVQSDLTQTGILIITPSKEWLSRALYPVTLDPTVEITIVNVHSHPQQGQNWTIDFKTQGTADLTITPNDQDTINDDQFTSLSCDGNTVQPQILANNVIYYPNWSCAGTSEVVFYTKTAGNHTMQFNFGGQVTYAYNSSQPVIIMRSTSCTTPTGGTVTYADSNGANPRSSPAYSGGYTVHTFTSSGTFRISRSGNVATLIVGGGASGASRSGGNAAGGGGAGEVTEHSSVAVTSQAYTITVAPTAAGVAGSVSTNGNPGNTSSAFGFTSLGGGYGGSGVAGGNGASGGGSAGANAGGTGSPGYNGGAGVTGAGAGGGGAGAVGVDATTGVGGNGGAGKASSYSGASVTYGGGGGGGGGTTNGTGGSSIGGNGGTSPTAGAANTGSGGGAGTLGANSGAGGSGIVIIKYLTSDFSCSNATAVVFRTGATADYGTGADGDVTIPGITTLTSNKNYNSLTVNSGATLNTAGYTVRVLGTLTNNGTITDSSSGAAGGASGGTGGTGGDYSPDAVGGTGGTGGTKGKAGGSVKVYANTFTNNGTIHTNGAAGTSGTDGGRGSYYSWCSGGTDYWGGCLGYSDEASGGGGGGGGGAGGAGGTIVLTYGTRTIGTVTTNGGTGGSGGAGGVGGGSCTNGGGSDNSGAGGGSPRGGAGGTGCSTAGHSAAAGTAGTSGPNGSAGTVSWIQETFSTGNPIIFR